MPSGSASSNHYEPMISVSSGAIRFRTLGSTTKFHLAKNLGVDCAKPDIWLKRVAAESGEDVQHLCAHLAQSTGDKRAIVDSVIWRACQSGIYRPGKK